MKRPFRSHPEELLKRPAFLLTDSQRAFITAYELLKAYPGELISILEGLYLGIYELFTDTSKPKERSNASQRNSVFTERR